MIVRRRVVEGMPVNLGAVANPNSGTVGTAAKHIDDEEIRKNFNYSKFSSLANMVLGDGDENALKTLERFRAGWREKYGFSLAGSSSATMGAITEASSSPMQTEGCSLMQSDPPRVFARVSPKVPSEGDVNSSPSPHSSPAQPPIVQDKRTTTETLLPPGPPGLPFIGNLHQFATTTNLHVHLWELSRKYGSPMHMKLGPMLVLLVSSAKLAKEVLKTQDSIFCSRPKLLGQQKVSYNYLDIAFSPFTNYWKEMRKITVVHLFGLKKAQSFRPIQEDEISRMVAKIQGLASSSD
ncbi:cytochrome [Sesamum alatum]|uniref:Cytochrome n=1 Tax=Sesamum alatum TaxID=300844 RepID=A0AAE2CCG5_9LAMI|nr:cytochrome [Sesamum alatum]